MRERKPDYHIDYELEQVEGAHMSGRTCYVQQKGHHSIRFTGGVAQQRFRLRDLEYYSKLRAPIFLMMVDVRERRGFYVFLQEWINANMSGAALRGCGTKYVPVPETNDLADLPRFLNAFTRSLAYMRERFPGSVGAAIREDQRRLEELDPRFDVRLDVVNGAKIYHLQAREDVLVRMTVRDSAQRAFCELHDFGRPLNVSTDAIELEGFPLMDEFRREGESRIALRAGQAVPCEWLFWLQDPWCELRFKGEVTLGAEGLLFRGELDGTPLDIEVKLYLLGPEKRGVFTVILEFPRWRGRAVRNLPWLNELAEFVRRAAASEAVHECMFAHGKRLFGGTIPNTPSFAHSMGGPWIEYISDAAIAAERFGINPVVPLLDKTTHQDVRTAKILRDLAVDGVHTAPAEGVEIAGSVEPVDRPEDAAKVRTCTVGELAVQGTEHHSNIFGTRVELGALEMTIDLARPVIPRATLDAIDAHAKGPFPVRFVGVTGSTLVIRKRASPLASGSAANATSPN